MRAEPFAEERWKGKKARLRLVPEIAAAPEARRSSRSELAEQEAIDEWPGEEDEDVRVESQGLEGLPFLTAGHQSSLPALGAPFPVLGRSTSQIPLFFGGSFSLGEEDSEEVVEEHEEEKEEEEEAAAAAAALRMAARQEAERARHTAAQQRAWQRLLAARVRLQGALGAANRLPLSRSGGGGAAALEQLRGPAGAAARRELRQSLAELARLRGLLGAAHPELAVGFGPLAQPPPPEAAESDSAAWWRWLAAASAAGRATEERVVNEWNQRTNVQAGRSGFKGAFLFFVCLVS